VKFVSITLAVVKTPKGVTLYYAAVDAHGQAWWWDTDQPSPTWQPLPPHPARRAHS
jgi:hypothetical protein